MNRDDISLMCTFGMSECEIATATAVLGGSIELTKAHEAVYVAREITPTFVQHCVGRAGAVSEESIKLAGQAVVHVMRSLDARYVTHTLIPPNTAVAISPLSHN